MAHRLFGALIVRQDTRINGLVLDSHACATDATHNATLQERRTLTRHGPPPARTKTPDVMSEGQLVALELFPRDITGMDIANENHPLFPRDFENRVVRFVLMLGTVLNRP